MIKMLSRSLLIHELSIKWQLIFWRESKLISLRLPCVTQIKIYTVPSYMSRDGLWNEIFKKVILLNLDDLQQRKYKSLMDKVITPRPIFPCHGFRRLWINVYPNLKIRPKWRYVFSFFFNYYTFRYNKITGGKSCPKTS